MWTVHSHMEIRQTNWASRISIALAGINWNASKDEVSPHSGLGLSMGREGDETS